MILPSYQSLDQLLEAVAVASWDDLIHAGTAGLVHIKYRLADDHSLANLQVWASETRGRWLLVCEHSGVASAAALPQPCFQQRISFGPALYFSNLVIEHESAFDRAPELNRDSLVHVQLPNEDEKLRALKFVNELPCSAQNLTLTGRGPESFS